MLPSCIVSANMPNCYWTGLFLRNHRVGLTRTRRLAVIAEEWECSLAAVQATLAVRFILPKGKRGFTKFSDLNDKNKSLNGLPGMQ
jgi:hypothetical protein